MRTEKGAPGKSGPPGFALTSSRPLLRNSTKQSSNTKAPLNPFWNQRGMCRFFGASSVASALSTRSGATPRGCIYPNSQPLTTPPKPDISTLLRLGHFYFALTSPKWPMTCHTEVDVEPLAPLHQRAITEVKTEAGQFVAARPYCTLISSRSYEKVTR